MLVRINNNVWSVSAPDFKRFGHDADALKLRAKSAKIVYTIHGDSWFRTSLTPRYDASTECNAKDLAKIESASHIQANKFDRWNRED